METNEIIVILGLVLMTILFVFSIKMGFEHLIKNYKKEIEYYFRNIGHSIVDIKKTVGKEKIKNPYKRDFQIRPFMISPLVIYKYRVVLTEVNGIKKKNWVEIKICYLLKPKIKFELGK